MAMGLPEPSGIGVSAPVGQDRIGHRARADERHARMAQFMRCPVLTETSGPGRTPEGKPVVAVPVGRPMDVGNTRLHSVHLAKRPLFRLPPNGPKPSDVDSSRLGTPTVLRPSGSHSHTPTVSEHPLLDQRSELWTHSRHGSANQKAHVAIGQNPTRSVYLRHQ